MKDFFIRYKTILKERWFLAEVLVGFAFLALGISATYYANIYTTAHASNAVTDIILDNVPVMNMNFIFSEGATLFVLFLAFVALYRPRRIPFVLKSVALFIIIRSIFMMLTHIAPPTIHSYFDTDTLLYKLSSGDDLFFSAHTGLPFLLSFVFWETKWLRYTFFACSAVGGTAVLLGHLHYSIDVFSALFIAYGIYQLARNIFRRDYEMLASEAGA